MNMAKLQISIAPALLCKTKAEFLKKLRKVEPYVKRVQYDVMDNVFVANKTVQPSEFRAAAKAARSTNTSLAKG